MRARRRGTTEKQKADGRVDRVQVTLSLWTGLLKPAMCHDLQKARLGLRARESQVQVPPRQEPAPLSTVTPLVPIVSP